MYLLKTWPAVLVAMQAVAGLASPTQPADALRDTRASYVNMAYWPSWAGDVSTDIDGSSITHLLYAFSRVLENGTVLPPQNAENWGHLSQFKEANPLVKTLLSIGGWPSDGQETWFAAAASSNESRELFVQSATQLMLDGKFDGLDIDWEFPKTAEEYENHAMLLEALRMKLNELGKEKRGGYHYLLTIAIQASSSEQAPLYKRLDPIFDFWNIMAYDYVGQNWPDKLVHNANLYRSIANPNSTPFSIDEGIQGLKAQGVSTSKMVLGFPSYARIFEATKLGESKTAENFIGVRALGSLNLEDFKITCDEGAKACTGYDKATKQLATFDTVETVGYKAEYAKDQGLAGVFMWDLSQDMPSKRSLHVAAAHALSGKPKQVVSTKSYSAATPQQTVMPESKLWNSTSTTPRPLTSTYNHAPAIVNSSSAMSPSLKSTHARVTTTESFPSTSSGMQWSNKTRSAFTSLSSSVSTASLVASSGASKETIVPVPPNSSSSRLSLTTSSAMDAPGTQSGNKPTNAPSSPSFSPVSPTFLASIKTVYSGISGPLPSSAVSQAGQNAISDTVPGRGVTKCAIGQACHLAGAAAKSGPGSSGASSGTSQSNGSKVVSWPVPDHDITKCATGQDCHLAGAAAKSGPGDSGSSSGKSQSSGFNGQPLHVQNGQLASGSDGKPLNGHGKQSADDSNGWLLNGPSERLSSGPNGQALEGPDSHPSSGSSSGSNRKLPGGSNGQVPSVNGQSSENSGASGAGTKGEHGPGRQSESQPAASGSASKSGQLSNSKPSPVCASRDSRLALSSASPAHVQSVSPQSDLEAGFRALAESNPDSGHGNPAQAGSEANHPVSTKGKEEAARFASSQAGAGPANSASTQSSPVTHASTAPLSQKYANSTVVQLQRIAPKGALSGGLPTNGQAKAAVKAGAAQIAVSTWAALSALVMLL